MSDTLPKEMAEMPLEKPATLTLRTVAELGVILVSLAASSEIFQRNDDIHALAATRRLLKQLIPQAQATGVVDVMSSDPQWDCGDPDCPACTLGRESRRHQDHGVLDGPIPFMMKRGEA